MKTSNLCLALFLSVLVISCEQKGNDIVCHLEGTVEGRESDTLMLLKVTEDFRFNGTPIPIINNEFKYDLMLPATEAYMLAFKEEVDAGAFLPVIFFPENGKVNFILHSSEEAEKNQINGGQLNEDFRNFNKEINETFEARLNPLYEEMNILHENGEYYNDSAMVIRQKLRNAKDPVERSEMLQIWGGMQDRDLDKTSQALQVSNQINSVNKELIDWRFDYMAKNQTILSYYLLLETLEQMEDSDDISIEATYNKFILLSEKYPDHPYTAITRNLIEAVQNIQIGEKYIDFSAPDLEGNVMQISKLIDNQVAIIDLWASWCGPCIAKSRTMVPVYDEFQDKGFTIVGVAREFENTKKLEDRLAKENYPWLNLLELDDQNNIWEKYGIPKGGGALFMVDRSGTILAINPTAEEVRDKLNTLL